MKRGRKIMIVLFIIILGLVVLIMASYINHRIQLQKEEKLRTPLGQMVEIGGNKMSVYCEGSGDQTLVFMSGGGTCSPILDFKSLYSLLSDEYKIVVVEKFGYGYSDIVDKDRKIDSILEDTRAALEGAGVNGPFVLCPHSMSGIEALYWAQKYPEEVEAIIGLDMAVPQAYADYDINMFTIGLGQFAAKTGITRLIPNIAESDAIRFGTLSQEEKEIYRAIFFSRTATNTMINEVKCIKDNASKVASGNKPQIPMLLFISNGTGTGWDKEAWVRYQEDYLSDVVDGQSIELDCPHYIHDHAYESISVSVKDFLLDLRNK